MHKEQKNPEPMLAQKKCQEERAPLSKNTPKLDLCLTNSIRKEQGIRKVIQTYSLSCQRNAY